MLSSSRTTTAAFFTHYPRDHFDGCRDLRSIRNLFSELEKQINLLSAESAESTGYLKHAILSCLYYRLNDRVKVFNLLSDAELNKEAILKLAEDMLSIVSDVNAKNSNDLRVVRNNQRAIAKASVTAFSYLSFLAAAVAAPFSVVTLPLGVIATFMFGQRVDFNIKHLTGLDDDRTTSIKLLEAWRGHLEQIIHHMKQSNRLHAEQMESYRQLHGINVNSLHAAAVVESQPLALANDDDPVFDDDLNSEASAISDRDSPLLEDDSDDEVDLKRIVEEMKAKMQSQEDMLHQIRIVARTCPDIFRCSISHEIMTKPVICIDDGQIYDRANILEWYSKKDTAPFSLKVLGKGVKPEDILKPLSDLESGIAEFKSLHPDFIYREEAEELLDPLPITVQQPANDVSGEHLTLNLHLDAEPSTASAAAAPVYDTSSVPSVAVYDTPSAPSVAVYETPGEGSPSLGRRS